jgi:hypoxanthine phosphoribosyltransferase
VSPPVLLDAGEIDAVVHRLARELADTYDDGVVLVGLLKGSVVFLADLVRAMTIEPLVDFLAITAYAPDSGRVRIVKDIEVDLTDRDVVLVDGVLDTGLTVSYLLGELRRRGPRSLEVCVLVDKSSRRVVPVPARFVGVTIDDPFVVGFGLDHAERYRNLRMIAAADPLALAADPDCLVPALYAAGGEG